ncbi:MAG TPA: hypothetical protein VLA84_03265 [Microcoleus sp.]|nr:hypothetical protein [Microcoleus sp.]
MSILLEKYFNKLMKVDRRMGSKGRLVLVAILRQLGSRAVGQRFEPVTAILKMVQDVDSHSLACMHAQGCDKLHRAIAGSIVGEALEEDRSHRIKSL